LLPTLSSLSVSDEPGGRLRHRRSSGSLRISPLHPEFRHPLSCSSPFVSARLARLSRALSAPTQQAAYGPFTPSKSGQRLPPLSYRGCWHRVSRGLFSWYRHHRPTQKEFTTRKPSSSTRRCSLRLAPIGENPLLLPPVGVWAVSQSQSAWSSSQTRDPSSAWCAVTAPTT
jgi:hypothetical protein